MKETLSKPWILASLLLILCVVLGYRAYEGFRISSTQRACEITFQSCIRGSANKKDVENCNKDYNACMGTFNTDASGGKAKSYGSRVYQSDASGNRRLVELNFPDTQGGGTLTPEMIQERNMKNVANYTAELERVREEVRTGNYRPTPLGPRDLANLIGYNEEGTLPTQKNLDTAQGKNWIDSSFQFLSSKKKRREEFRSQQSPADGKKKEIQDVITNEIQDVFKENEYMYVVRDE